ILEKTNNQLSLWYNPFGVFIASLGVLFTVLAIVVAFVIYRQSQEHRRLVEKSIRDHNVTFTNLITEHKNQLENSKANLDSIIAEYTLLFEAASDDQKQQFQNFISRLEEQRAFIDT